MQCNACEALEDDNHRVKAGEVGARKTQHSGGSLGKEERGIYVQPAGARWVVTRWCV